MFLNFWAKTSGTWINIFTVAISRSEAAKLIGFNLLEVVKIRVASFLPAIALAPSIYYLATYL